MAQMRKAGDVAAAAGQERKQEQKQSRSNSNTTQGFAPDTDLLRSVLARLDRGDCPDNRWPDQHGDYWPLSPLRPDSHAGSFSVGLKGWYDFATGEGGSLADLAKRLGVLQCCTVSGGVTPPPSPPSLTLEEYAKAKALSMDFLEGLGLGTVYIHGRPCVRIPYYDTDGTEVGARLRLSMTGKSRFRWRKGTKVQPYGLERLDDAQQAGYIVLVEGESDTQTLWHHDIPALGIPGATTWRPDWSQYLDGLTVYAWQENDDGGETFARTIGQTLPEVRIITAPPGRKDVSECHVLGDDLPALLQRLMAEAKTYRAIAAQAASEEAQAARLLAGDLVTCPNILDRLEALLPQLGVVGENANAKLIYLALTSRLLDRPVSVAVKGPSAGGKSFLVGQMLRLLPPSAFLDFTSMSEHALIYDDRPISHKFIVLYEAAGLGKDGPGEVNTLAYCLRSLLSEGRIRYVTVEKTSEGLRPREIDRPGPTGLITTTTLPALHPENETRHLSITVRDDTEQTRNILAALADRANGKGPAEPDLAQWQALQTWLELAGERRVTIPYAHVLAERANPRAVRLRRDFGQLLSLIQAHAILHQENRGRDEQGRIVATLDDYRAVYELVLPVISEGVEATVSPVLRETVEAVVELSRKHDLPVSITELAQRLELDKSAVSRRVRTAQARGYLVNTEDKRGRPLKLLPGEPLPEEEPVLPDPDTVALLFQTGDRETPQGQSLAGGEGGGVTPPENTATLQHLPDSRGGGGWCNPPRKHCNTATVQHLPSAAASSAPTAGVAGDDAEAERILEGIRALGGSASFRALSLRLGQHHEHTRKLCEDLVAQGLLRRHFRPETYALADSTKS